MIAFLKIYTEKEIDSERNQVLRSRESIRVLFEFCALSFGLEWEDLADFRTLLSGTESGGNCMGGKDPVVHNPARSI
jgi:hypothetical protein